MVMRYHWGLGVGHMYARLSKIPEPEAPSSAGPSSAALNQVDGDDLQSDASEDEPDVTLTLQANLSSAFEGDDASSSEDDLDSDQERSQGAGAVGGGMSSSSDSGMSSDDGSQGGEGLADGCDEVYGEEMDDMYGEDYELFSYD